MKDITCPKCGTVFQVDESDYAAIVAQVRSTVFNEELDRRAAELREQLTEQGVAAYRQALEYHQEQAERLAE